VAIDRGKYVVIKREDLDAMYNGRESYKREVLAKALDGCVVIRLQDVFAAPALHSYAAAMGVATRFMMDGLPAKRHLQDLADYFHEMAMKAEDEHTDKKVPD